MTILQWSPLYLVGIYVCIFFISNVSGIPQSPVATAKSSQEAFEFVAKAESELHKAGKKATQIEWAYATNITDENEKKKLENTKLLDALSLKLGREAKQYDINTITDQDLKRKLDSISQIGTSILEQEDLDKYNRITTEMEKIYSKAKVPGFKDKSKMLSLDPDITLILAESRDPEELEYYWTHWREVTGKEIRNKNYYEQYVDLRNKAARMNGFRDGTESQIHAYESKTFVQEMAETWNGLKPLYEQLHAFVRQRLHEKYGNALVDPEGPIPAHLLGNMWAQSWNNIEDMLKPYPEKPSIEVNEAMKERGWTPKVMFEKADDFFQSIGFEPMTEPFWEKSVIKKPEDGRDLVCHASAWDFYGNDDYRIKMCTKVTAEDFVTVNHEMGHIQYFMRYRNQSYFFRNGANPGFHEGVADILSLAVGTASYYQKLGLLSNDVDVTDEETNINILFSMALQRLAFMPFGYLVDKYRWDLYSEWATEEEMNCHWVKLRSEIQGIQPPNMRSEDHFDAGAKYHVAANVGYVRYFTAFVYEFQFYRTLCLISNQYDPNDPKKPLHRCNFYGSKEAGDKLDSMLKLGSSKPWKDAMEVMTGQRDMSTDAFREYFKPLEDWLISENKKKNVKVGWKNPPIEKMCKKEVSGATVVNISILTVIFMSCIQILVH